jgi:hypothetical protein
VNFRLAALIAMLAATGIGFAAPHFNAANRDLLLRLS